MMKMISRTIAVLACFLAFCASAQESDLSEPKPFAEMRVVLQLSDQVRESVVLDVANNLIRHYGGPDMIDIEIVTFDKGVRLLFAESPHQARIASLAENGVRFYVCENTMDTIEKTYGSRPKLDPHAQPVGAGVAHILEQVAKGYTLVRP